MPFRAPATTLGNLAPDVAALALAAAGDVTFVIDREGIIRDIALGGNGLSKAWANGWIDRPWIDTVTVEML